MLESDETNDPDPLDSDRLDEVLAEYLQRTDRGEEVDREQLIAEHPDLADGLRAFFGDLDALQSVARCPEPNALWPPRDADMPLGVVQYLGDYELLRELGRGGMGVVYLARQTSLSRFVAVKMILGKHLDSPDSVDRFRREAEAVANLKHPRIVAIHEIGQHEGQHYFSMDFIAGRNLAEMTRDHPLAARPAATYIRKVAEAVHYAHERGIIHRDLKSSNILVDEHDEPHVTDFGLAKRIEGDVSLTDDTRVLGTPSFMPPEQAESRRGELGPPSDVYSLGATLYDLLTGRPPFRGDSPLATVQMVSKSEPVSPRMLNPAIPRDLETICLKCLEKAPARRYATADDLARELERYLQGEPILARPVSRLERVVRWSRRNPLVAALATAVLLLVIASSTATIIGYVSTSAALGVAQQETTQKETALADARKQETLAQQERQRAEREAYASQIGLAYQKWLSGEVAYAENILDACPRDLRHWEWAHLKHLCHLALKTIHTFDSPSQLTLSPDGSCVASEGGVWDTHTGLPLFRFSASWLPTSALGFSQDGKWLAVGSGWKGTFVWNVAEKKQHLVLEVNSEVVALSPHGEFLAVGCTEEKVADVFGTTEKDLVSWSVSDGKTPIKIMEVGDDRGQQRNETGGRGRKRVRQTVVGPGSSGGGPVARPPGGYGDGPGELPWGGSGSRSGEPGAPGEGRGEGDDESGDMNGASPKVRDRPIVALYDISRGGRVQSFDGEAKCLAFSPDGAKLAAGLESGEIRIWDVAAQREIATLSGHSESVGILAFSSDGTRLASGSADGSARVWDVATEEALMCVPDHATQVTTVRFVADDTQLVSASRGSVRLSDVATGELRFGTNKYAELPFGMVVRADSEASGGGVESEPREQTPRNDTAGVPANVAMSDDGRKIAWSDYRLIHVQDLGNGSRITYRGHKAAVANLMFTADGERLASAGYDQTIRFWDAESDRAFQALPARGRAFAFSPDSQWIAAEDDGQIKVWNVGTSILEHRWDNYAIQSLAFSPSGRYVCCRGSSGVRIYSVSSGQPVWHYDGEHVHSVAFCGDESTLVIQESDPSTYTDHQFSLWSLTTGERVAILEGRFAGYCSGGRELVGVHGDEAFVTEVISGRKVCVVQVPGVGELEKSAISCDGRRGLFWSEYKDAPARAVDFTTQRLFLLSGSDGAPRSFQIDARGQFAVTAGLEECLLAWDLSNGKVTGRMTTNDDKDAHSCFDEQGRRLGIPGWDTLHLAISPDAQRFVSISSRSPLLRIWQPMRSRELLTLTIAPARRFGHYLQHEQIEFSPDGRQIAVHDGETIWLLDGAETSIEESEGRARASWKRHVFGFDWPGHLPANYTKDPRDEAKFVLNGNTFVAHDGDGAIVARDTTTARTVWEIVAGRAGRAVSEHAAYSGDGTRITFCSEEDAIRVLDTRTSGSGPKATLLKARTEDREILAVAISFDGRTIAARHRGGTVTVWNADTGLPVCERLVGQPLAVQDATSTNGSTTVDEWLVTHDARKLVGLSANGQLVWSLDDHWVMHVWSVAESREILAFPGKDAPFAVCPDGTWFAYVENGPHLRIWDVAQGGVRHTIPIPDARVCRLQASRDGQTIMVFALSEGASEAVVETEDLTGNHQRLPENVCVRSYDIRSGQERLMIADSRGIVDISPDGKLIAWGDAEGIVRIAEFGSQNAIREYRGHDAPVTAVAFSHDGQRIAAGGEGGEVLVWDGDTAVPRLRLREHEAEICALEFSSAADRLASFSTEGRCNVWDVSNARQSPQAARHYPANIRFPDAGIFPKERQPDSNFEESEPNDEPGSPNPWEQLPGDFYAPEPPGWQGGE